MKDYCTILNEERENAIQTWNEKVYLAENSTNDDEREDATVFVENYENVDTYLAVLGLDDAECFFESTDSLTRSILDSGVVTDVNVLHRVLSVRIYSAMNLKESAR